MTEHEHARLIEDNEGLTRSDLEYLRFLRQHIPQETVLWLKHTNTVMTVERLDRWKKQDERSVAVFVVLGLLGSILAIISLDKLIAMAKVFIEIIGGKR